MHFSSRTVSPVHARYGVFVPCGIEAGCIACSRVCRRDRRHNGRQRERRSQDRQQPCASSQAELMSHQRQASSVMLNGFTGVPPRVAPERGKVLSNEERPQRHSGWAGAYRSGWFRGYLSAPLAGGPDNTLRVDLSVTFMRARSAKCGSAAGASLPTRRPRATRADRDRAWAVISPHPSTTRRAHGRQRHLGCRYWRTRSYTRSGRCPANARPDPAQPIDYRPLASNRTAAIRLCTPSRSKIERVWNFTVLMLMNSRPPISS